MKKLRIIFLQFILLMTIGIPNVYANIKVSPKDITFGLGNTQNLTIYGANGSNISYFSSNKNIITVSNDGLISGVSEGTAYISVTDGTTTDICKVKIVSNYVPVSSISLAKSSATMLTGDTNKIELSIFPINASNKNPTYISDNDAVVSVDNNGYITAKSLGTANIHITIENKTTIYKVVVVDKITLNSISIIKNVELKVNSTKKLSVTYSPSNATDKKVAWKSSNPNIVTVDENGNIKGIADGTATITVISNDGKHEAVTKVNVISNNSNNNQETPTSTTTTTVPSNNNDDKSLRNIYLNKNNLSLNIGDEEQLNLTYYPSDANDKNVTWKSSDTKIVTVDENGKVKALSEGTVTITVTSNDGGHQATCEVVVNASKANQDNSLKSITLDKTKITLKVNRETKLNVIFNPEDVSNKKVTWESSDNEIATVNDGLVKALKPGKVDIKVTSEDGNYEAVCKVRVYLDLATESLAFEKERETMYVSDTLNLEPISTPQNTMIDNPIWTSSDESVATVTDGEVTALMVGTTIITISDESGKISASVNVNVIEKPAPKLVITIEGYDIKFDPDIKSYTLTIGSETALNIKTNYDPSKVSIGGNRDLKNGSIVTVTVTGDKKTTYVFNIKKKGFNIIYLIAIVSVFLLLNIIRIVIKNKKK